MAAISNTEKQQLSENLLNNELYEAFEERAGIMEYDGGLSRPEAEAAAVRIIQKQWYDKVKTQKKPSDLL